MKRHHDFATLMLCDEWQEQGVPAAEMLEMNDCMITAPQEVRKDGFYILVYQISVYPRKELLTVMDSFCSFRTRRYPFSSLPQYRPTVRGGMPGK